MPIALSTGGVAETVTETIIETVVTDVVATELTASQALNVTRFRHQLAALYNVSVDAVVIVELVDRRRLLRATSRRLSAVRYQVSVSTDAAGQEALMVAMQGAADQISTVAGVAVTQGNVSATTHVYNTTRNVTTQREVSCPRGSWCSAGSAFPWCAFTAHGPKRRPPRLASATRISNHVCRHVWLQTYSGTAETVPGKTRIAKPGGA